MALKKWTAGDTITERSANNKGVRKGLTSDLDAIVVADREDGDWYYNDTVENPQVETDDTNSKRGNIKYLIGADANEVTVTGATPTERKNISFVKDVVGFSGNVITIVAEIKTTDSGTTAHFRVRIDGGGTDKLDLTTTSTGYVIKTGKFDIRTESAGRHTLEFFMDDGAGDIITNRELEVYGI